MSMKTRSFKQNTMSVYGGAGGRGVRISSSQMSCGTPSLNLADGLDLHVGANEKATMQNLNDRLASYLDKVHKLEKENEHLENLIREWYQSRNVVSRDYSGYFATIEDLKEKICIASMLNAKTILDTDNAKLAADDFKVKYESELAMRLAVEADIAGLRKLMHDLNLLRLDLENQYETLKEDVIILKKNHEEDVALLRTQMGGQVNVSVDASPSRDLNEAMAEIRQHYEGVIAKNSKELELWYQNKIAEVEQEVQTQTEVLVTTRREITELRNTLQRLEIELQGHLTMKTSLERTLAETQGHYAMKLTNLQNMVKSLEEQLSQIHSSITDNKHKYDMLLDLKTKLEMEIAEYRRLLDGEDDSTYCSSTKVVKKVITVVEKIVDGRMVQTNETVDNLGQFKDE
ncbi:keratin, type I cytoskeletal 13-like [Neolamprologus brichardi]|uniref:keratin 98 n=1 Tax=Neolamprologus brichardi TaxID=32507 RepID=UPI001643A7EC|nr:keratin 98 [Neolamprologus brichardi]XP_006810512.2 keratin, type I cytoskeletal 13-like [Neolamprologus brichardi]